MTDEVKVPRELLAWLITGSEYAYGESAGGERLKYAIALRDGVGLTRSYLANGMMTIFAVAKPWRTGRGRKVRYVRITIEDVKGKRK